MLTKEKYMEFYEKNSVFVYEQCRENFSGQMENRRVSRIVYVCAEKLDLGEKDKSERKPEVWTMNKMHGAVRLKVLHQNDVGFCLC